MGRSQETFKKKENEKKKEKKRKDKQEKKEERKASSNKSQNLEDMMAYVDENGNLTSTPPDPKKRTTINVEDVRIGVTKSEHDPTSHLRKGKVTFFNDSKGYGFIRDLKTQENVFVHFKGLVDKIKENDQVTFETEHTPKGLSAFDVRKIT